jgi:hypothetical protein
MVEFWSAKDALMSPASPAVPSVCPITVLIEPTNSGPVVESG